MNEVVHGKASQRLGASEQVTHVIAAATGKLSFAFFFGLALALWSANAGAKAIIDALNIVYGVKERRFHRGHGDGTRGRPGQRGAVPLARSSPTTAGSRARRTVRTALRT